MADSVVEAALAHYRAGNTDAAIELLLGAIDADPSSALYHYHLGNVYWDQELRSEAREWKSLQARLTRLEGQARTTRTARTTTKTKRPAGAEIARGPLKFVRPPDLATDTISLIPVVQHALRAMDGLGFRADVVVSMQATSPGLRGADRLCTP